MTESVSVVIPAQDEEATLGACLWSVLTQPGVAALRVIVVANGCTDRTVDVARGFRGLATSLGHRVEVLQIAATSKHVALTTGSAAAEPGIEIYLDADTVLGPGALAALSAALRSEAPRMAGLRPAVASSPDPAVRG
ncbi:MAG: hypothetical protein QOF58_5735, partial [Pseudonocardiales bacterium]|nr:hypothetical protein [Pseudonocardiales bacterium]